MELITGTVERITYYNEENGYGVIKVMPEGKLPREHTSREGLVTVVGVMQELGVGEEAQFAGEWYDDPRYGMQLKVQSVTPIVPTSVQGITRYLSSGIVKGIGPKTAEKIVDHFKERTLEVLNREPERLKEVTGLKANKAEELAQAWRENYTTRQAMIFLQGYGVTSRMAKRIHDVYGTETITKVQENPYALADDVWSIGFLKADQIARSMGFEFDSYERLRAGIKYALNHLALEGHTFGPRALLLDTATELLQLEHEEHRSMLDTALNSLLSSGQVIEDRVVIANQPIDAIYLKAFYRAETYSAGHLHDIAEEDSEIREAGDEIDWDEFLTSLTKKHDVKLSEQQQSAVKAAFTHKLSVLTGGPGTGKTTTLRMVIEALRARNFNFALASPTGRAAKRLSEATGEPAFTIHRLLGYSPDGGFSINETDPLDVKMLIVDEASMIDLWLFQHLLNALEPETHLMLVGDVDQLPSVGAGNVLRDVIGCKIAYVTRLERIFRQGKDSHIIVNAHRINDGKAPYMDNKSTDFYFFGQEDPTEAADLIVDIVKHRLPTKFDVNPDDVQVIAPMYRGPSGVNALNQLLQSALNGSASKSEVKLGGRLFRAGDKVMQTRNNYDKEVFNGDIGIIIGIDDDNNTVTTMIDGRWIDYDYTEANEELMLAYCISTHRSQGSEYPVVVMPLLTQHYMMLQRNLLYTAITRAKKMVVMVGSRRAVHMAVQNNKVEQRYSGLLPRILEMITE